MDRIATTKSRRLRMGPNGGARDTRDFGAALARTNAIFTLLTPLSLRDGDWNWVLLDASPHDASAGACRGSTLTGQALGGRTPAST